MATYVRAALVVIWCVSVVLVPDLAAANKALRKALLFHASFDRTPDADFALGDRRIHTAGSYKKMEDAKPGLEHPDVSLARGAGRYGGALKFARKNTRAVYYLAENNIAYQRSDWNGTVSFWLSLDPATDLDSFSDPLQVTDEDYNDAAIWVDFTMGAPRQFRLGAFGDLNVWNPENLSPLKNPAFLGRLVVARDAQFSRSKWTHVVIAHARLGGTGGGVKLYVDGVLQGATPGIPEPFTLDVKRATIRLGVSYAGLLDDLAVFSRELSADEVKALYRLKDGVRSLGR